MKRLIKDGNIPDSFTADGIKYKILPIEQAITPVRYFAYEGLKFSYSFDLSPETVAAQMAKAHNIINSAVMGKTKPNDINVMDALTIIYGMVETLKQPTKTTISRGRYMMLICSLFIVEDGEDLTKWDESMAEKKIERWNKEGFSMMDFFLLGLEFVRQLNNELSKVIANG